MVKLQETWRFLNPQKRRFRRGVTSTRSLQARAVVASTTLLVLLCGCGGESGPPRYDVSGNVTYDGRPVPQGVIQFRPDTSKGNSGPATSANIVEGKYDTSISGKGTVGGPHIMIIRGFDGQARPEEELPNGMPLFPEYTTNAELPQSEAGVLDIEVPK